ncbi:hypothetical protein NIES4072_63910 [Nostoc commune NIES-4072]|uniref:LamG-like jellyroll fold domain-containing protein n=1 Tax=Nostoc commune NIES-4072 TaxID=2005467 RepID=A0A2R5FX86_NOSCO|nr:LamG domain-containing protein [Nostoc commune]BBD66340.1 hypothetical protein NIES4070_27050 [Nostoc commune HK-02]GBG22679.1 hypothetical protein NIES4072_63910 [Nostoc commune NIES-4072]
MTQIKDIAISKTVAADNDFLIMQSPVGETYKITKADLLQGLSSVGTADSNSDNLFSSVVLLLSNNNNFLDKSSLANSLSVSGITISSISKFGANSAYFAGSANILTTPNRNEFNLGNSDFTIEAWVYPTVLDGNPRYVISKVGDLSNNSNRSYGLNVSANNFQWYFTSDGINDSPINFPCNLQINNWYHIAVSRTNNNLYGFLNGVLISSTSHSTTYFNSSASLTIGSFGGYAANGYPQLSFIGNIEKNGLRVTKVCRYTSSFTVSTKAFSTI